jgi:heavy metal sensor kinase
VTVLRRVPIRLRVSVVFTLVMAAVFAALAVGLYHAMDAALTDVMDTGLRARAATIEAALPTRPITQPANAGPVSGSLDLEPGETFSQVTDTQGTVISSTLPGSDRAIVEPATLASLDRPTFFTRRLSGVAGATRILADPVTSGGRPVVVIVGTSTTDRTDALRQLLRILAVAGPLGLLAASAAGWFVAGVALRPVERMRQEANVITLSGIERRLSVPEPDDEISRLGNTLNDMLDRLHRAVEHERQFLDHASHELRTPLAILKTELDLALSRPRTPPELTAALQSASQETDRLATLADDLLVLSRTRQGRLQLHPSSTALDQFLADIAQHHSVVAKRTNVTITASAPSATVMIDQPRVRQALDNLITNALQHAPRDTTVDVRATVDDHTLRITVDDDGPGFPAGFEDGIFRPFNRSDAGRAANGSNPDGAGLGLAITEGIARAHHGTLTATNHPDGGAHLTLTIDLTDQPLG